MRDTHYIRGFMVATGQGKIFQGQGKVSEFYFESGEIEILTEKSGKIEIITL